MKKPFQVGDRVAVYGAFWGKDQDRHGFTKRATGYVVGEKPGPMGEVFIQIDGDQQIWCHPKQCRRLVKKERRRIWVHENACSPEGRSFCGDKGWTVKNEFPLNDGPGPWREFIEVRKK